MARLEAEEIHELLAREDKVSLGGNGRVIWAPEFPLHADRPGFWDHACYLEHPIKRLFTTTLIAEDGGVLPLEVAYQCWTPDRLTQVYHSVDGLTISEEKAYLDDTLVSRLTVRSTDGRARRLQVIVWTLQQRGEEGAAGSTRDEQIQDGHIEFVRLCAGSFGADPQPVAIAIAADRPARTFSLNASEGAVTQPRWELTPFYEKLTADGLPGEHKAVGGAWGRRPEHQLYMGLEYVLDVPASGEEVTFTAGVALAPNSQEATTTLHRTLAGEVIARATVAWTDYWAAVPSFTCDDPYLERAYWYRWFGLRLNTVRGGAQYNLPHPCVFEGINPGWFRHAISYSAQAHMRELRWMKDPELAQGSLLNFIDSQRADGAFPGGIMTTDKHDYDGFYHANWGTALRKLLQTHPDRAFLERVYPLLVQYAHYFQRERDPEGGHLYDVLNQWETGQEYMSRYLLVDEAADQWIPIRLKGIDATGYLYELYRTLAWMAGELGHAAEAAEWEGHAEATAQAVREHLWEPDLGFFVDLDPRTGRRGQALTAAGFYPFMSDLATTEHLRAIRDHLLNPAEFWTDYPVPSTALTDPYASAEGEWKDVRTNCPWNGRSWLMTNSHVCEALAHAAQTLDESLRSQAAELIRRCIRETFINGDVNRPSSYEYYNPLNGKAPFFRGTDDYMHSWVVDLIVQYVVGLQPGDDDLIVVDPLPFGLKRFALVDARIKGHRVDVQWRDGEGLQVKVDGVEVAQRDDLGRLELRIATPSN